MSNYIAVSNEDSAYKIAVIKDGRLWQFFYQSLASPSYIDNIYLGRIIKITPIFIWLDIGLDEPAILRPSSHTNKLIEGQKLLVQACQDTLDDNAARYEQKEKGIRVSTAIHLAGRYCVYHPHKQGFFSSNKLNNHLKEKLAQVFNKQSCLTLRSPCTFLKNESELLQEKNQLHVEWEKLIELSLTGKIGLIKPGLTTLEKLLRDLSPKHEVIFDDVSILAKSRGLLQRTYPHLASQLRQATLKEVPLFESLGIEENWDNLYSPFVPIPTGGNLYIEETACITTIDVNTPKISIDFNEMAAALIVSQIRLRQLSGNIMIDFIRAPRRQRIRLLQTFEQLLNQENTQNLKIMGWSHLGFLELQGPRYQDSLPKQLTKVCQACEGSGRVSKH